jgi:hypothetical protein
MANVFLSPFHTFPFPFYSSRKILAKLYQNYSPYPPPHRRASGFDLIYYSLSLAGSRRRSLHQAVRVHISDAPLVVALIGLDRDENDYITGL